MTLTTQDLKTFVQTLYDHWNAHELDAVAQMIDETGYVDHKSATIPPRDDVGREIFRQDRANSARALAGTQIEVLDMIAEGDKVAVRVIVRAQQIGPYHGRPPAPDGMFEMRAISIMKIARETLADAKLIEHWEEAAVVAWTATGTGAVQEHIHSPATTGVQP